MLNKKIAHTQWQTPFLFLVVFLAVALRVWYLQDVGFGQTSWFANGYPTSDTQMYDTIGKNILQGRVMGWIENGIFLQSYCPPGYPFFLSFIYHYVGQDYRTVIYVQILLSALTSLVVFHIGSTLFGRLAGAWAALLFALYFPYIRYPASLLSETLFIFLVALSVLYTARAEKFCQLKDQFYGGIFLGLAILTRPAGIAVAAAALCWLGISYWGRWKAWCRGILIMSLAIIVVMLPWWSRSVAIHGQLIPLTTIGIKHMEVGYNPKYKGRFYTRRTWWSQLWREPFASEVEKYTSWKQGTVSLVKEHPDIAFRHTVLRFFQLWESHPFENGIYGWTKTTPAGVVLLGFFLAALGCLGVIVGWIQWRSALFLWLLLSSYTSLHAIAGVCVRYRHPIDWVLFLFIGVGGAWLWNKCSETITRKLRRRSA